MFKVTLARRFAVCFQAYHNCFKGAGNPIWEVRWEETLERMAKELLPSGSGFDNGVQFDIVLSRKNRLVFHASYHHMNQHGYYNGWLDYDIFITPDLADGFSIRTTGVDSETKGYVGDQMYYALAERYENDDPRVIPLEARGRG